MISLTLSAMTTLYSGRVGLSRLFAVTTLFTLFLFSLTFGSWWAVGRSAGAENVATSLIANTEVRTGVAEKLIEQVTSDADPEIQKIVEEKRELLTQAVSEALISTDVTAETKKIIDDIYAFYTGASTSATIDVKALIKPILDSMAKVDPTFNAPDVKDVDVAPITLDDTGSAPNLAPIKSGLAIAVFGLFLLLVLSIFGVAKYSGTKNSFVGIIGWEFASIGLLLILIFYGATMGVKTATESVSDPLVNSAAPVVAQTFLSMFRLEGILLLVVGLIGIFTWARVRRGQPAQ